MALMVAPGVTDPETSDSDSSTCPLSKLSVWQLPSSLTLASSDCLCGSRKYWRRRVSPANKWSLPWQPRYEPEWDDDDHGNSGSDPGQQPGSALGASRGAGCRVWDERAAEDTVRATLYLTGLETRSQSTCPPLLQNLISNTADPRRLDNHVTRCFSPIGLFCGLVSTLWKTSCCFAARVSIFDLINMDYEEIHSEY